MSFIKPGRMNNANYPLRATVATGLRNLWSVPPDGTNLWPLIDGCWQSVDYEIGGALCNGGIRAGQKNRSGYVQMWLLLGVQNSGAGGSASVTLFNFFPSRFRPTSNLLNQSITMQNPLVGGNPVRFDVYTDGRLVLYRPAAGSAGPDSLGNGAPSWQGSIY